MSMTSLHGGSKGESEPTTTSAISEDASSRQSTMVTGFNLPPPPSLEIHDGNIAEKWKKFRLGWSSYSLATELNKKSEAIQVATLLTVIGEEARDVYSTFDWSDAENKSKIEPVLQQFADYCQPRKNVPFERDRFNKRAQEAGESYDQYKTALRKLAEGCEFHTITPEEVLRDRLIFGIRDVKVRERLLRESQLTLISRYTSQIIALLAVNYAATVVDLTILQPFVEVESAETQKTTQALRLLTKRQTMAMIQTKFI